MRTRKKRPLSLPVQSRGTLRFGCLGRYNFSNIDPNAFNGAGSNSKTINIYSNLTNADQETFKFYFDNPDKVQFHPYKQWDPSLLNLPTLPSLF